MFFACRMPWIALGIAAFLLSSFCCAAAPPADGLPLFTTNPRNLIVAPGQPATFTVEAQTAAPPVRYQWRHHGTNTVDATNSSLAITDVQDVHAGPYSVIAMTEAGAVPSLTAWLSLSNAGVRVLFAGGPISTWQGLMGTNHLAELWAGPSPHQLAPIGSAVAMFIPGHFSGGLRTVTNVAAPNPVYCQVRFRLATGEPVVNSNLRPYPPREEQLPIQLTNLIVPTFPEWPDPMFQPERPDVYAPINADYRLTLRANSFATLFATQYQWHKDGLPIGPSLLVTNPFGGVPGTNLSLTLSNLQPDDAASYTVLASNSYGFQLSAPLQLSVLAGFPYAAPRIAIAPGQTLPMGTTITFSAIVDGPVQEMYWSSGNFLGYGPSYTVANANPATANNLTLHVNYPESPGNLQVPSPWVNVVPHLVMAAPSMAGNGDLSFQILAGTLSTQIEIQASQNLSNWTPVTTLTATGGVASFVLPSGNPLTNQFFRAVGTP
jgi:hypothetical protein